MVNDSSHQITLLLIDWSKGDENALEQLMPLVYEELRQMARNYMRRQPSGHTFQTTELIHEAYLKIAGGEERQWQNRAHFFGVSAQLMRRILVDFARKRPKVNEETVRYVSLDEALSEDWDLTISCLPHETEVTFPAGGRVVDLSDRHRAEPAASRPGRGRAEDPAARPGHVRRR